MRFDFGSYRGVDVLRIESDEPLNQYLRGPTHTVSLGGGGGAPKREIGGSTSRKVRLVRLVMRSRDTCCC